MLSTRGCPRPSPAPHHPSCPWGLEWSRCRKQFAQGLLRSRAVFEPGPSGVTMNSQLPFGECVHALPWKSTVEVPSQLVPAPRGAVVLARERDAVALALAPARRIARHPLRERGLHRLRGIAGQSSIDRWASPLPERSLRRLRHRSAAPWRWWILSSLFTPPVLGWKLDATAKLGHRFLSEVSCFSLPPPFRHRRHRRHGRRQQPRVRFA